MGAAALVANALSSPPAPAGVPLRHVKVVAGAFAEMTAPEKAAVDAAQAAADQAVAAGAVTIERIVANTGLLPLPPPRPGLVVVVTDGGAGVPAIAVSGPAQWAIFDSDRIVS